MRRRDHRGAAPSVARPSAGAAGRTATAARPLKVSTHAGALAGAEVRGGRGRSARPAAAGSACPGCTRRCVPAARRQLPQGVRGDVRSAAPRRRRRPGRRAVHAPSGARVCTQRRGVAETHWTGREAGQRSRPASSASRGAGGVQRPQVVGPGPLLALAGHACRTSTIGSTQAAARENAVEHTAVVRVAERAGRLLRLAARRAHRSRRRADRSCPARTRIAQKSTTFVHARGRPRHRYRIEGSRAPTPARIAVSSSTSRHRGDRAGARRGRSLPLGRDQSSCRGRCTSAISERRRPVGTPHHAAARVLRRTVFSASTLSVCASRRPAHALREGGPRRADRGPFALVEPAGGDRERVVVRVGVGDRQPGVGRDGGVLVLAEQLLHRRRARSPSAAASPPSTPATASTAYRARLPLIRTACQASSGRRLQLAGARNAVAAEGEPPPRQAHEPRQHRVGRVLGRAGQPGRRPRSSSSRAAGGSAGSRIALSSACSASSWRDGQVGVDAGHATPRPAAPAGRPPRSAAAGPAAPRRRGRRRARAASQPSSARSGRLQSWSSSGRERAQVAAQPPGADPHLVHRGVVRGHVARSRTSGSCATIRAMSRWTAAVTTSRRRWASSAPRTGDSGQSGRLRGARGAERPYVLRGELTRVGAGVAQRHLDPVEQLGLAGLAFRLDLAEPQATLRPSETLTVSSTTSTATRSSSQSWCARTVSRDRGAAARPG